MRNVAIFGGAGFVGCNTAYYYLNKGDRVFCFDNLSRDGVEHNLSWLKSLNNPDFTFVKGNVTDFDAVRDFLRLSNPELVFNFAAQVAVTTSVTDPRTDFECNLLGSFNVLEGIRLLGTKPSLLYTSTNKVYGGMEEARVILDGKRYAYADYPQGIAEDWPLDFHSPYGCSKGGADQYCRDYARIYSIPITVFRMSCIYGIHQFGNEDQGWVAHFVRAALLNKPINIYGDGMQVRDILFIHDLIRGFDTAINDKESSYGQIYNIGGGASNTISLLELVALLEEYTNHKIPLNFGDWRPGDQMIYVSNIKRAKDRLGWSPNISKQEGVKMLLDWMKENIDLFE